MHNRDQYIENIKNYISSEEKYSARDMVDKALEEKKSLIQSVTTDHTREELYSTYDALLRYPEQTEMTPAAADKVVEYLVRNDIRETGDSLEKFKAQIEYLHEVLDERPDALSDEQLDQINKYVRDSAYQLKQPTTTVEAVKADIMANGLSYSHARETTFFHKLYGIHYGVGLLPEQKGTMDDAVVLYDINQAVEKLGGTFAARAQVSNQGNKEAAFIALPVKSGDPLRKAEMIKTAMPHGLSPAFKGIVEGMEIRIEQRDIDSPRGNVFVSILHERDADVTALVDALQSTVSDLDKEAVLQAEAIAAQAADARDHAALEAAIDAALNAPVKKQGPLGRLLAKATALPVTIPMIQDAPKQTPSTPEQTFE